MTVAEVTVAEVTVAVQRLSTGRAPRTHGLPVEFYENLWGLIGKVFF